MPAGKTFAPRRIPAHDVCWWRGFPKREVLRVFLFVLPIKIAGIREEFFNISARKFTVVQSTFVISCHIKVHRTIALVRESAVDELLGEFNLFEDMSRRRWLNGWRQQIENIQNFVEIYRVFLHDLHRFQFLEPRLLHETIIIHIAIIGQMSGIGDIPHITYVVTEMGKWAENKIEGHEGAHVAEMHIAVNRRTADIHADGFRIDGFEDFFFAAKGIVYF